MLRSRKAGKGLRWPIPEAMFAGERVRSTRELYSVAPVEVAGTAGAPERGLLDDRHCRLPCLGGDLVERLLARPDADVLQTRVAEIRLDSVHRLLDPRLLLGLEERVVVKRILALVAL